jgi:hypothetical protein
MTGRAAAAFACLMAHGVALPAPPDDALIKRLRQHAIERLKDADSARFRHEFLSSAEDGSAVRSLCGEVNAKNGYGGYTGFSGFIVTTEELVVFQATEGRAFEHIWPVWCSRPLSPKGRDVNQTVLTHR